MFQPFEINEMEQGRQYLCCIKMLYVDGLDIVNPSIERMTPVDIYVRAYIAKVHEDLYMCVIIDKPLGFSDKHYVRIFNYKTLPGIFKLPVLWALTGNVLTFNEDGKVRFVKDRYGKPLKTVDLVMDGRDANCIGRKEFEELCDKYKCDRN